MIPFETQQALYVSWCLNCQYGKKISHDVSALILKEYAKHFMVDDSKDLAIGFQRKQSRILIKNFFYETIFLFIEIFHVKPVIF